MNIAPSVNSLQFTTNFLKFGNNFYLKMFLLRILSLNVTIEAKMALESSLRIKYLSRKPKHHFILGYQVILKKYP